MITKVLMPKLSEAMETGKVIKWLKKEGDAIKGGDVIAEIETDKANVEIEAFGSGVLRKILVGEGGQVPVGETIGVIADPADDIAAVAAGAPAMRPAAAPAASPAPAPAAAAAPPPLPAMESYRSTPETTAVVPLAPVPSAAPAGGGRIKASPLARKVAAQSGVDLRLLQGTGPGGRIVRRDVESASALPSPAVAAAVPAAAGQAAPATARPQFVIPQRTDAEFEDRPFSPMRAIIAKRMPLSKAPVPHFYVTSEVAMDRAWALRAELNALEGQPKVSVTDLIIKACALALLKNPGVNAQLQGQSIRVFHRAHIGLAIALDEGLIGDHAATRAAQVDGVAVGGSRRSSLHPDRQAHRHPRKAPTHVAARDEGGHPAGRRVRHLEERDADALPVASHDGAHHLEPSRVAG